MSGESAGRDSALTFYSGLTLVPIHLPVIRLAAQIRAATTLRTPDALQLATAVLTGCTTFLTNDDRLRAVGGIEVLKLDDFVTPARTS